MSTSAIRYRRTLPTRNELREELNAREWEKDTRAMQEWADYLTETGRVYQ